MNRPMDAETLRRLSSVLDEGIDLDATAREAWLERLAVTSPELAPIVRGLLATDAHRQTDSLLDGGPGPAALAAVSGEDRWAFKMGDAVGPYTLVRELARGGMGEVWLAQPTEGEFRRVALKLPVLGLRRHVLVQRFERERGILGALAHPNIARLYDAGFAADGQPYLALEYVEGTPIGEFADAKGLDARERVALLRQVMDAVGHAHANLVIHRDLKPSNVLVTASGQAMLLDFGIAKLLEEDTGLAHETDLTRAGGRALTPRYAAPEQIQGGSVSAATDVWALGVLLYELLTGSVPFAGREAALADEVLTAEPPRPSESRHGAIAALPKDAAAGLDPVVLQALRKDPAERYATVADFAADLDRWLQGQPVRARSDSVLAYKIRKWRKHPASRLVAAMAALIIVGVVGGYVVTRPPVPSLQGARALTIAVLPFSNLTGDPAQAYVAEGLTADITSDLARIEGALIAPARSAQAYKDRAAPLADIAKALGVRFVLQGNVQRSGSKLRINAQLADTVSGAQLWSEAFDGDMADLFALQDQVTARIGNSVGRQVVAVAARESEMSSDPSRVADLLLRARALETRPQSVANYEAIEALNRQALALEPQNVQAMLGLALALTTRAYNFATPSSREADERRVNEAHDLTLKVRALDPDNSEVYRHISTVAYLRGDLEGSRLALETHLATHPKSASAHNNLGVWYMYGGEPRKAIPYFEKALELTPGQALDFGLSNLGQCYFMLGDDARAIEWLRKFLELNPQGSGLVSQYLAMAYARSGQMELARASARAFRRASPEVRLSTADGMSPWTPPAFRRWHETERVPAWRKAGLPE